MQTVIPDPVTQPFVSLAVEFECFSGMNNIRRSLGRAIGLWTAAAQADRFFVVQPGETITIDEQMPVFMAVSDGPLTATVNTKVIHMGKVLLMDEPTTVNTTFLNASTTAVVNLHITYLTSGPVSGGV